MSAHLTPVWIMAWIEVFLVPGVMVLLLFLLRREWLRVLVAVALLVYLLSQYMQLINGDWP